MPELILKKIYWTRNGTFPVLPLHLIFLTCLHLQARNIQRCKFCSSI